MSEPVAASDEASATLPISDAANCELQADKVLYPSFTSFMVAIQDPGKEKTTKSKKGNKEATVMTFPRVKKLCLELYRKILLRHRDRLPSLDKNENRGAQKLEKVLLLKRKRRSVTEVHPDYKQFASNGDNSVYTITNDPKLFGLDVVLLAFESHLAQAVTKTQGNRTPDDAMRIVWILLDPNNRATVQGILSGRKDRKKMDQSYCTTLAFFDEIASDFNDPSYVVRSPNLLKEIKDWNTFDPNNVSIVFLLITPAFFLKIVSFTG
jgi:hypothetical protein